jgi:hypothetical protein
MSELHPFAVGFIVLAAVATVVALATIASVVAEVRRSRTASPVVSITGRSTAVAAGRAA